MSYDYIEERLYELRSTTFKMNFAPMISFLATIYLEVFCMTKLTFYIRHHTDFLQDKFILVFKSEEAREYFQKALRGSHFEEVTSEEAENAARIGIHGKTIPYGYTLKLTEEEMNELSTANWEKTAQLLAEGNERLYREAKAKGSEGRK